MPPLTYHEFLQQSGVDQLIADFKKELEDNNQSLQVSDVTDTQGHQYVDLVQEGGGVLGIALVGYTYVLEKMGIRFFSLAGTSAGSINAMLLACTGNKEDEKSSRIVEHLASLNMFSFVDGKPGNSDFTQWIKQLIQQVLVNGKVLKRSVGFIVTLLLLFLAGSITSFIINFFNPGIARWIGLGAGLLFLATTGLVLFILKRFRQFAKNGYGLNCGDEFRKWMKNILDNSFVKNDPVNGGITSLAAFSDHFMRVPVLQVKEDKLRNNNLPPHMPLLTIITCDIIAERKIEFPRMWDLYWKRPEDVHPADFVRASMSIPVFFEAFTVRDIRKKSSFAIWDAHLNWQNEKKNIPDTSQFLDGGILSNFPINIFYNPNYPVPRMPTFGVRLQDGILDGADRSTNTFYRYIASLFATIRFNFDRDFITRNRAFNKAVCSIDVRKHRWLNFFMKDKEKIELFRKGAEAAISFLRGFRWEEYKRERLQNFELSKERFINPNNLDTFPFTEIHVE